MTDDEGPYVLGLQRPAPQRPVTLAISDEAANKGPVAEQRCRCESALHPQVRLVSAHQLEGRRRLVPLLRSRYEALLAQVVEKAADCRPMAPVESALALPFGEKSLDDLIVEVAPTATPRSTAHRSKSARHHRKVRTVELV